MQGNRQLKQSENPRSLNIHLFSVGTEILQVSPSARVQSLSIGFFSQSSSAPSMEPAIFISYSSEDKEIASVIATWLAAENISVWFDEWKITLGESITEEIQKALECTHFIVLISENTETSKFQKREFQSALASYIKKGTPKILPILLDDSEPPRLLTDIKYWKYEGGTEKDRDEIVRSITGRSPSQSFIRAMVKKYHELVIDDRDNSPLPFKACPECGSTQLTRKSFPDYRGDDWWFVIECPECGWSEVSQ